jgi:uracil-DNA glycosylase family 4
MVGAGLGLVAGDPAAPGTPVASTAAEVARLAETAEDLAALDGLVSVCRACPRLVEWRETVAATRRRAYAGEHYWGRPVPGFGAADARIGVVGLAPAAHGGNRTGRVFTGDRSGDWLFAALHRAGLASQATSVHAGDGLTLRHTRILAAVRCAPPANKPTTVERDTCRPWLDRELALLWSTLRTVVVLGGYGWSVLWSALRDLDVTLPSPRPPFAHGREVRLDRPDGPPVTVLGCYHVSQQNTFTGRLTAPMLDAVFGRARELAGLT